MIDLCRKNQQWLPLFYTADDLSSCVDLVELCTKKGTHLYSTREMPTPVTLQHFKELTAINFVKANASYNVKAIRAS